jgi:hypothetical protein
MVQLSGVLIFIGMMIAVLFPTIVTATIGFLIVGFGVSSIIPLMFSTAGKVKEVASGIAIATVSGIGFFWIFNGPSAYRLYCPTGRIAIFICSDRSIRSWYNAVNKSH